METPKARPRRGRRRALQEQRFSSYLTFGAHTTICLGIFLGLYALTLLVLSPLLNQEAPHTSEMKHGEVLAPVMHQAVDRVKHIPHVGNAGQMVAEGMAGVIKKKLDNFRHDKGLSDSQLMQKASEELENVRKRKKEMRVKEVPAVDPVQAAPGKTTGFMILGMHRSGTSMLGGLMKTGLGYQTGGPLIGGAFDNEKGFFERIDVVYQNDEFMEKQNVWWSSNVINYDTDKALQMKKENTVDFKNGEIALKFFNDPANSPWFQKDPRMCITLKTWLPLMSSHPAILFTYRHPLEVAMSLKRREKNFPLEKGLRLWIVYNMRALQNSAGLCRVLSSNEAILENPLVEIQRMSDELTSKCGVPKPPEKLTQEAVDRFVDPKLQHNKKDESGGKKEIANYDGCSIKDYESDTKPGTAEYRREHDLYHMAMKIYCDFKSGKAYKDDYEWPSLA